MRIIETNNYHEITAKKKFTYKGKSYDTNPFAVCNKSISKKDDPAKWERCVHHVKDNSKTAGIDIKPSHKGDFTSYCGGTVTEECIRKGLASDDPHVVQMANFARNARKWKN